LQVNPLDFEMASKKLKILCIHGFAQNAEIFRKKTAVVRKGLSDVADFIYASGPHDALPEGTSETDAKDTQAHGTSSSHSLGRKVLQGIC
jgi:hypothetical protein